VVEVLDRMPPSLCSSPGPRLVGPLLDCLRDAGARIHAPEEDS
jgi:hypothetical protein